MLKRKDSLIETMIVEKSNYTFKNKSWIDFHHPKKDTIKIKITENFT